MKIKIIRSNELNTTKWDGGTTTQLFIFPETAEYSKRNFQFRLSTATVKIERSSFTSLPGFSRKLMVLDGEITLIHYDHYTAQLKRFEMDSFEGDWKTSCIGRCTDFNLMTAGKISGQLSAIKVKVEQDFSCQINDYSDWFFVYVYTGCIEININHEISKLNKGDFLVISQPNKRIIEMKGTAELIISEIGLIY